MESGNLPELGGPTGKLSFFNMYIVIVNNMMADEKGFTERIKVIEGSKASDIDQRTLLR
jgi:hypothetical protein